MAGDFHRNIASLLIENQNNKLFYWRQGNHEIDFIIKKGSQLIAIEVKSGNKLKAGGIIAASKQFSFTKTLLIGIEGLNWKDFIKMKPVNLFD